ERGPRRRPNLELLTGSEIAPVCRPGVELDLFATNRPDAVRGQIAKLEEPRGIRRSATRPRFDLSRVKEALANRSSRRRKDRLEDEHRISDRSLLLVDEHTFDAPRPGSHHTRELALDGIGKASRSDRRDRRGGI